MRSPQLRLTVLSILMLALAAAQARADIFAAVNVAAPPPRTDFDVAIVNASLGTRVALPSVVNTTAFEIHPSISSDGRRLLFNRFVGSDGIRLLLVDTSTGDSADLFTPTEIALNPIFNSAIEGDGTTVATGRRFRNFGTQFVPEITFTDVRSFPTGPFPRTAAPLLGIGYDTTGSVLDVAFGGNDRLALHVLPATGLGELLLFQSGSGGALLRSTTADLRHPAMMADDSSFFVPIFFEHRSFSPSTNAFGASNLGQSTADPRFFVKNLAVFAPGPINTDASESQPAVTRDGRYFAFVRQGSDGHDRLFVRDLRTKTFLNPAGVDLGRFATAGIGSVSLYQRTVITGSQISTTGNVNATLRLASNIGILVQRIVGVTKERGQKQYELEAVGRVPLGSFGAGNVFTHWDFEVDGEPLAPGKYLVTVRAVEGDLVRELGQPQVLKIKKNGRAVIRGEDE